MYSAHNEGRSVISERFLRTLENEIHKFLNSISKNVYINKLDDIVNKYNNTYHKTIKMKPVDIKSNTFFNYNKEIIDQDPEFKIGDIVRITKYKNIFPKRYVPNWSEEVFVIKILKALRWGHMLSAIIKVNKLLERFTKKNCKKQIKKLV